MGDLSTKIYRHRSSLHCQKCNKSYSVMKVMGVGEDWILNIEEKLLLIILIANQFPDEGPMRDSKGISVSCCNGWILELLFSNKT